MIFKDQKLKKKNLWTAVGLVAFIVFLFIFTLFNIGVFERPL